MVLLALERMLRHMGSVVLQLAKPVHHGQAQMVVLLLLLLKHLRHEHRADLGWEITRLTVHLLC